MRSFLEYLTRWEVAAHILLVLAPFALFVGRVLFGGGRFVVTF